jgi:hypothetical protein
MEQGLTRVLNGREMTLGRYPDPPYRIGWVWKDTGLPANMEKWLKTKGEAEEK